MLSGKTFVVFGLLLVATVVLGEPIPSTDSVDCPEVCPALFAPLCATADNDNFEQFDNPCLLNVKNCARKRSALLPFLATDMHWCTSTPVENLLEKMDNLNLELGGCMRPCPMIYAPICVSNGVYRATLSNSCILDNVNCAVQAREGKGAEVVDLFRVLRTAAC